MTDTITVNGRNLEWQSGMNLYGIFRLIGYTIKVPMVLVKVNGTTVPKPQWDCYEIPAGADILVRNIFNGG